MSHTQAQTQTQTGDETMEERQYNVEFTTLTGDTVWNSIWGISAEAVQERMVRLIAAAHAGKPVSAEFGTYRSCRVTG